MRRTSAACSSRSRRARTSSIAAEHRRGQAAAERALQGALGRLLAVAEAYPDLKANQNFLELQEQLAEIEDQLADGAPLLQRHRAQPEHQRSSRSPTCWSPGRSGSARSRSSSSTTAPRARLRRSPSRRRRDDRALPARRARARPSAARRDGGRRRGRAHPAVHQRRRGRKRNGDLDRAPRPSGCDAEGQRDPPRHPARLPDHLHGATTARAWRSASMSCR